MKENAMDNIVDFIQEKAKKDDLTLTEIIDSFTAHNCDKNRPYLEQQPLRARLEISGLTRRDICDCMALGILECRDSNKYGELPRVFISEKGTKFDSFEELVASKEGYGHSFVNPEKVTYNDLYGFDLNDIDPVAAIQNMACHLEERMGIYPALLDGRLVSKDK